MTLTVKQLVKHLQQYNPDIEVYFSVPGDVAYEIERVNKVDIEKAGVKIKNAIILSEQVYSGGRD